MTRLSLTVPLLSCLACVFAVDQPADAQEGRDAVLAEVDGVKLTRAEFERKNPGASFQARNSYYDAERKALDEAIDQYLLERQAQKENLTTTALLERHVNSKIAKDPSEEVLRVYYEGVDTNDPFDAVRDKIVEHLRQRRLAKAKSAYMQSLRSQAKITIRLAPPRAQVTLKDTPIRGVQDARVLIVE